MITDRRVTTLYIRDDAINLLVAQGKRVKKWASLPLEPGLVSQGLVLEEARVADGIDRLFKLANIRKRRVIVGLGALNSLYRLISMPELPQAILPEAVKHEARRVIPAPLEEVYLSYQVLPAPPGETRLFLAASPRNVADALMRTLRRAGVQPYLMDLTPLALCRTLDEPRGIIVSSRSDSLVVIVMEDRLPQVIRRLSLTGEVVPLAERLPAIIEEVDRTIDFYNSSHKEKPLDSTVPMFVSGDLVQAPQSWPSLAGKLSCPVSILSPPLEYPANFDPNEFMINIGLALKELLPGKKGANFSLVNFNALPEVYRPEPVRLSRVLVPVGVVIAAGLLVFMGLLAGNKAGDNPALRSQLTSAESQIVEEQKRMVTLQEQVKQVEADIPPVQARANILGTTLTSVTAGREQVDEELAEIFDLLPESTNLTALNHGGESVTVLGTAADEADIFTYARALRTRFPDVAISSITATGEEGGGIARFDFSLLLR